MDLRVSPLYATVPLEGTQNVTGLLELERRARQAPNQQAGAIAVQDHGNRYTGPHWWELSCAEVLKAPSHESWQLYFGGAHLTDNFNVPGGMNHLKQRLNENLAKYINNHIIVAGVILLIVLYMHPKAFVGTGLLVAIGLANLHIEQTVAHPVSEQLLLLQGCSSVLAAAAAIWGSTLLVVFRWLLYTAAMVLTHSSLRIAASENTSSGVPICSVFRGRPMHADPRRLFRKAWQTSCMWREYAMGLAVSWLRMQAQALRQWLRQASGLSLGSRRTHDDNLYMD